MLQCDFPNFIEIELRNECSSIKYIFSEHSFLRITMANFSLQSPYSVLLWSVFSRGISPYSVRMQENVDQNNSKYKLFSSSGFCQGA